MIYHLTSRSPASSVRVVFDRWGRVVAIAVLLALPGCQTHEAVIAAERESVASVEAYSRNADRAVEALLRAYRAEGRGHVAALLELDLLDATERVTLPPAEEGAEPTVIDYLPPAAVRSLLASHVAALERVDGAVDGARAEWAAARGDLEDALALRAKLREYLEAGGIDEEQIVGLAEALARELEGGQADLEQRIRDRIAAEAARGGE